MGDLSKNLQKIKSFTELIEKHIKKIHNAVDCSDYYLLKHYKKETDGFIKQAEDILKDLNNHESVITAKNDFLKQKNILSDTFKKYEKYYNSL